MQHRPEDLAQGEADGLGGLSKAALIKARQMVAAQPGVPVSRAGQAGHAVSESSSATRDIRIPGHSLSRAEIVCAYVVDSVRA